MKKIIILLALLMPLAFVANAQKNNLRKIQVLDYSHNPVKHSHLYVFETLDKQPTDMSLLLANLKSTKGFIEVAAHDAGNIARVLIYVDESLMFKNNNELKNVFSKSGFDVVNIPIE